MSQKTNKEVKIRYKKIESAIKKLRNIYQTYSEINLSQIYTEEYGKLALNNTGYKIEGIIKRGEKNKLLDHELISKYKLFNSELTSQVKMSVCDINIFGKKEVYQIKDEPYTSGGCKIPSRAEVMKWGFPVIEENSANYIFNAIAKKCSIGEAYNESFNEIYANLRNLIKKLNNQANKLNEKIQKYQEIEKKIIKNFEEDVSGKNAGGKITGGSQTVISQAVISQTVKSPGGEKLTIADLRKKIREALKEGKIKKANNLYDKLRKKVGKERAREIAKKLIEKTGAKVTLQKGEFVKIKPANPATVAETGAVIVTSVAPVTVDFVSSAIKRETYLYEKQRAEEKEGLYREYIGKVSTIDPKAENAQKLLNEYQNELDNSLDSVDKKYDTLIANLKSEDYSSDSYVGMTQEEIESDLASAQSDMAESVGEKISAGGAYSYNKSNKFADIQIASVNEKEPTVNVPTPAEPAPETPPATNNTPSNEAVATPVAPSNSNQNSNATKTYTSNVVSNQSESAPATSNPESPATKTSELDENPSITGDQSDPNQTIGDLGTGDTETEENENLENVISIPSGTNNAKTSNKKSGLGVALPIGLGVAATGAAAVAGVRYLKNKKQTEDVDYSYDDENNNDYSSVQSDSAYMQDNYLDSQEEATHIDELDNNQYTDSGEIEEELGTNKFMKDLALDDLN